MATATLSEPLLLELDGQTWKNYLDNTASWLGNLLMTQSAFRKMAEDTVEKIHEPHIKQYIREIADKAREHERRVEDLYRVIGRDPSGTRKAGDSLLNKASQMAADLVGWAGGAAGGWKDLRELLLANLDAIGAFSIAEQVGFALGLHEITDITFPIIHEKTEHQLLLMEYMLEMGPVAILYKMPA